MLKLTIGNGTSSNCSTAGHHLGEAGGRSPPPPYNIIIRMKSRNGLKWISMILSIQNIAWECTRNNLRESKWKAFLGEHAPRPPRDHVPHDWKQSCLPPWSHTSLLYPSLTPLGKVSKWRPACPSESSTLTSCQSTHYTSDKINSNRQWLPIPLGCNPWGEGIQSGLVEERLWPAAVRAKHSSGWK